jgi:ribonuclease T1
MRRTGRLAAIAFGLCLTVIGLVAGIVLLQKANDLSSTPRATTTAAVPATDTDAAMATVAVSDLPKEARATLDRIRTGGPYPYTQDGMVFENREGLLPSMPRGYYREFTVTTPRSDDRGARRIVAGAAGERYYTDDHYDSFVRIEDAP